MPTAVETAQKVPVLSMPQTELLTVNVDDMPLLRDSLTEGAHFKPLLLDPEIGIWSVMATFAPGVGLPIHLHTGSVHAYTLSGSWIYEEYPDQPQTAGSYLYEPASSVHTLAVPASNTEDTVVLFIISGANVSFTEDGQFHSVLDAFAVQHLVRACSEQQGIEEPNYLVGGLAGFRHAQK